LTFEEYCRFINEPKHLVNPVRDLKLFDSNYLEVLSKTPWWGVPLCWCPYLLNAIFASPLSVMGTIGTIALGIFLWTFGEYILHRFVFHAEDYWLPYSRIAMASHFLFHGIHHAFPMD
jgi:4-hydroxysphinganine ceramide fatty acyl 2-hydroxylase